MLCNVDPLLNVGNNQSTPSYSMYHNCFPHCSVLDVIMNSRCRTFLNVAVLPSSSYILSLHGQILFGISGITRDSTRHYSTVICQNNKWFPEDGSRVNCQNVVLTLSYNSQFVLSLIIQSSIYFYHIFLPSGKHVWLSNHHVLCVCVSLYLSNFNF
jgi:hypothetical protein